MGRPRSSCNVAAEGPFARPSTPWHFQHCTRAYTSCPALTLSGVTSGSGGISIGVPDFSFCQRGEKFLIHATKSARCCLVKVFHGGMFERSKPRAMVSYKSSSVGRVPVGVERHLNIARVKSRGFGSIHCALSPLPSPS